MKIDGKQKIGSIEVEIGVAIPKAKVNIIRIKISAWLIMLARKIGNQDIKAYFKIGDPK
jgi:hypothetical protein